MLPLALLLALGAQAPDPRISTSAGQPGGAVVLWPRVVPATEDPGIRQAALLVQQQLTSIARTAAPGRALDVRPEPERVCPQSGCQGIALGAALLHRDGGCAVVAWASVSGRSHANLAVWAGDLELKSTTLPFREPQENAVVVQDFVSCSELAAALPNRRPGVEAFVRAVVQADRSARP